MTLDGGFSPFAGTNFSINPAGTLVTFGRDPVYPEWCSSPGHCQLVDTDWTGSAMYVLGGTGQGQLAVFASGGIKDNRTWTLAQGFKVPLDATSFVSVFEHREKSIYRDNYFADGGCVQLYGGIFHAIVANNTMLRSGGFITEGLRHQGGFIPCYFVETLNNRILEGLDYTGSTARFLVSGYHNASLSFTGAMAAAIVYRGNQGDNSAFALQDAVTDALYEGNTLTNSDAPGFTVIGNASERVFLRGNRGL